MRRLPLCAAALVLSAALAGAATAAPSFRLTRSAVNLPIGQGGLGAWSPVTARAGAVVAVDPDGTRPDVLRLTDRQGLAGYVAVTTSLTPQTIVTVRARAALQRQHLRRTKVRSLVAVTGRDGSSYQAGVVRSASGVLRWAIWTKGPGGRISGLRDGGRARLREFHDIRLTTRWGAAKARASLAIDGTTVARTPRQRRASAATRVIVGLGRVSKRTETGAMLVRSVRVTSAAPVGVARVPAPAPAITPPGPGAAAAALPGREIFRGDFETGSLGQWNGLQRVATDRISVVGSPARDGRYAARFEVRDGDNPIGYGDRAELQSSTGESEGDERWYSWSTMFAADFPRSSAWQVVSQWHANADGSPPLAFYAENDDLVLTANRMAGPGSPLGAVRLWRGPLRRGTWNDIRMHVKWSGSDSVGFVELWIDGVPQKLDDGTTRRAVRTLYPGVGAYFKQGLYRQSGVGGTGVLFHDGLRVSAVG